MYKLRVVYSKQDDAKFIPFNYMGKIFERVLRRIEFPFSFSEGYTKHIKISFAPAIPVGVSGNNEAFDILSEEKIDTEEFKEKTNKILPSGIKIKECFYIDISDKISSVKQALYIIKKNIDVKDYTGPWEVVSEDLQMATFKINLLNFKHKILFDKFGIENIIERKLII